MLWQANIYAVLTILATLWILPITFAMEPPAMVMKTVNAALGTGDPYSDPYSDPYRLTPKVTPIVTSIVTPIGPQPGVGVGEGAAYSRWGAAAYRRGGAERAASDS